MPCIFCVFKVLINNNLCNSSERPLFFCVSASCNENSANATRNSPFCTKWIRTTVYVHIFQNISFCFPNARNTCRRSRHRHTAMRYAVFLQQSPKNSTAECLGSIALCLLHGQKTPPAIRKTANWPAPTYTLTTKSFANASTRIFSKKRSGNFPNTFYCFSIKINIFAKNTDCVGFFRHIHARTLL